VALSEYTGQDAPEFLTIGHVTRDLLPGGGWRLGGSASFAALTAARLDLQPGVVTSGTPDVLAELRRALPHAALATVDAAEATTFENIYDGGTRRQVLRGRAAQLDADAVPAAWRAAPIVLLAPLAREVDVALATAFPHAIVAATPQGWLRRWDAAGAVYPGPLHVASAALSHLDALILSREDLLPPDSRASGRGSELPAHEESDRVTAVPTHGPVGLRPRVDEPGMSATQAEAQIAAWARVVPIVVVTQGAAGALLYLDGSAPEAFPSYPACEVDPTGAGDVFAAAFLCHLHATGEPRTAADFANRVAALSIEREGTLGVPTRAELLARYPDLGDM
jgi:sugar/nucleoside kinase (ribokinase family)